jgi:hypothetical protein
MRDLTMWLLALAALVVVAGLAKWLLRKPPEPEAADSTPGETVFTVPGPTEGFGVSGPRTGDPFPATRPLPVEPVPPDPFPPTQPLLAEPFSQRPEDDGLPGNAPKPSAKPPGTPRG